MDSDISLILMKNSIVLFALLIVATTTVHAQVEVPYDTTYVDCLYLANSNQREFVFNSEREFKFMETLRYDYQVIDCRPLPKIDFTKKTLIGYLTFTEGCSTSGFHMTLTKSGSTYNLVVKVKSDPGCRMGFSENYWLVIDKMWPEDKIEFTTIHL